MIADSRIVDISEELYCAMVNGLMDSELIVFLSQMEGFGARQFVFFDPDGEMFVRLYHSMYHPCEAEFTFAPGEEIPKHLYMAIRSLTGEWNEEHKIVIKFVSKKTLTVAKPKDNEVLVFVQNLSREGIEDLIFRLRSYGYSVEEEE